MSWRVAVLGAALVAAAVMGFVQYDESVASCCHDNALYLVAGKSLATGQGYKILSLPGQPAQTKYPPLFPFLLSWAWRIAPTFPEVLAWAYALTWLWLPVFVWTGWRYFRVSGVPEGSAILLAAGLALQPHLSIISQSILADVAFAVFAWGALLALGGNPLTAGLLAALAILTKTSGVAVLGAGAVYYALQRRWRELGLFSVLPAVALVAWVAWSSGARLATTDRNLLYYVDYLGLYRRYATLADVPGIAWTNFSVLLSSYGAMVVYNNELSGIIFQFSRLVGIFSVIGLVRRARRVGMEPGLWFGIFFSLQAILWNFPPDPRLACPVLPLIWLGFREEALAFARLLRTSWRNEPKQRPVAGLLGAVAGLILVVAAAAGLYGTLAEAREFTESRRFWWELRQPAYAWIKRHAPAGATVLSFDDPVLWLATGRRGVTLMQPWESLYTFDQKGLTRLYRGLESEARARGLDYLLVATRDLAVPLERKEAAAAWREIFSSTTLDKVWETDDMMLIRLAARP